MKLLHIDSSILSGGSISRQLTKDTVAQWVTNHPGTTVDYLDLAVDTPSHLSADSLGFRAPAGAEC
ncbi:NAD(P)H-dependent oxidoreductase [Rhodoferax saidenbachensis]|uniref:FMN-dependent NADH-azoreductase n=1 Tax=Rhodoferax saidenbachensis TaxID=1484693 RepID=A0ABU1ZT69_9BURK|nr:FMN-dependent NADH-azoreductase [Rhodoferax saidenbachensis]